MKQVYFVVALLLYSTASAVRIESETENLAIAQHRMSQRSTLRQRQRQRQRSNHRSLQKQKEQNEVTDENKDAQETLSGVEIAEVQTQGDIGAEDADAEQKRQDKAKFDEVMTLMNKYDQAEAHIKWVNSPEYAQQKEQVKVDEQKRKEQDKQREKEREEQEKIAAEEDAKEKKLSLVQQEEDLRHNQEYVKNAVSKYVTSFSETDGRRILSKDKAYIAAGDILGKVRKLRGVKQQKYLDEYFASVWDNHDPGKNNLIEENDVDEFFNDILGASSPEQNNNEDE